MFPSLHELEAWLVQQVLEAVVQHTMQQSKWRARTCSTVQINNKAGNKKPAVNVSRFSKATLYVLQEVTVMLPDEPST